MAFALADAPKADSAAVISALQQAGLEVIIMSGDHQSVVDYVGNKYKLARRLGRYLRVTKHSKLPAQVAGKKGYGWRWHQ